MVDSIQSWVALSSCIDKTTEGYSEGLKNKQKKEVKAKKKVHLFQILNSENLCFEESTCFIKHQ